MFEVFQLTFSKVGMLLVFVAIGYFMRHYHKLPGDAGRVLSLLCTMVFLPSYLIYNMSKNFTREMLGENALLLGYGVLFAIVSYALAFLLAKPFAKNRIQRASLIYAFALPNYGYFGYPVIEGVFGSAVLAKAMIFLIPLSLSNYSFAYALFSSEKKIQWKKVLLSPMLLGLLIGIGLGLSGIQLPGFVSSALSGASNCMSPCAMLLAGFLLGKLPLKQLLSGWQPYVYSAIRLVGIPIIFAAILLLTKMQGQYLMMPLLIAGIPLGLNLVVYPESQGFEKQAFDNAKICFVSYLLSLFVLPFTFSLLAGLVG